MYLRVSLTDRCNLRCTYCLSEGARFAPRAYSSGQLRQLMAAVAQAAGVYKIRLTGGEPTLCDDLVDMVAAARELVGEAVAMTSNGILLEPLLPALQDAGLRLLNISLDAVDIAGFRRNSRRDGLLRVINSIRCAQRLGFTPLKINCVARRHSDLAGMVRFAAWEGVHLRFIELMAIGESAATHARDYISAEEMRGRLAAVGINLQQRQDLDQATSRVWTIPGCDPAQSSVGFITTNSAPFCATCDRLRLTSQGRLHTCLFDEEGHQLGALLDQPQQLAAAIRHALGSKAPPAAFHRQAVMAAIGG